MDVILSIHLVGNSTKSTSEMLKQIFFNLLKFEYGASNMFCFVLKKTVGVLHYMFLAMLCKETDFQYLWLL